VNNEKLNIQDLIDSVATKTGNTKKDSEFQLKEFVGLMHDALLKDGIVKIKGLGTLKLQWNKSRKSVNIQTGEEIEIAGHYKIDFAPENSLKDFANQPFAHLENTLLDIDESQQKDLTDNTEEQIKLLSTQALEIKSILSDINSITETSSSNEQEQESSAEDTSEDTTTTQEIVSSPVDNTTLSSSNEETKESEEEITESANENENIKEDKSSQKRSSNKWLWILLLLLIAIGIGAYFYFFKWQTPCEKQETTAKDSTQTDSFVILEDSIQAIDVDTTAEYDEFYDESETTDEYTPETVTETDFCKDYFDFENCEILAEIEVAEGARLAWYSTKYYGNRDFWPYIYAANRDRMSSPNDLEKGQKLRIPKLPAEMTDADNEDAVRWCKECAE